MIRNRPATSHGFVIAFLLLMMTADTRCDQDGYRSSKAGEPTEVIPLSVITEISEGLRSPEVKDRIHSLTWATAWGSRAAIFVAPIASLCHDPSEVVRARVCHTLDLMEAPASVLEDVGLLLLRDSSESVRIDAATHLAESPTLREAVIERLVEVASKDPSPTVRSQIFVAARRTPRLCDRLTAILIKGLHSQENRWKQDAPDSVSSVPLSYDCAITLALQLKRGPNADVEKAFHELVSLAPTSKVGLVARCMLAETQGIAGELAAEFVSTGIEAADPGVHRFLLDIARDLEWNSDLEIALPIAAAKSNDAHIRLKAVVAFAKTNGIWDFNEALVRKVGKESGVPEVESLVALWLRSNEMEDAD